jgi:hypothetical protein
VTASNPHEAGREAPPDREAAVLLGIDKRFVRSVPFDGDKVLNSRRLTAKAGDIAREIDNTREARKRTAAETEKLQACVSAFTANLLAAWKISPALQIGIPKGAGKYTSSRYRNSKLTYRFVIGAFDGLERLGYLQVDLEGFYDKPTRKGKVTKVRGTGKWTVMEANGR